MIRILVFVFLMFLFFENTAQLKKYPENFGDIFLKKRSQNSQYSVALLGKNIFTGSAGYSVSKISYINTEGNLREYYRNAAIFNFNVNPWKYIFIRNSFFFDLNTAEVELPWLADYFYQIGYYNWNNKSFSFGYENYQSNRWKTIEKDFATNFKRGYFFISYNLILSGSENKNRSMPIFWDKTSQLTFSPIFKVHPEYPDEFGNFGGNFKPIVGLNFRYVIVKNIYIESGLFYYPLYNTILPWDPDYTYGFGVYNWKAFKINFTYGNWVVNRFPWNKKEIDHYGFMNGVFNLSVTYSW